MARKVSREVEDEQEKLQNYSMKAAFFVWAYQNLIYQNNNFLNWTWVKRFNFGLMTLNKQIFFY